MSARKPGDDYAAQLAKFARDDAEEARRIARAKEAVIRAARRSACGPLTDKVCVCYLCAPLRRLDKVTGRTK